MPSPISSSRQTGCSSAKAALLGAAPCLVTLRGHSIRGSHRWTCWGDSVSQRPSTKRHMQLLVRVAVALLGSVLSCVASRVANRWTFCLSAGWHAPSGAVIFNLWLAVQWELDSACSSHPLTLYELCIAPCAGSGLSDMFGGLSLGIPAAAVAAGSSMDHREDPHQSPMIEAGTQRPGQQAALPTGQRAHQQPAPAVQGGEPGLDDIFGGLALGGERWPGTVAPWFGCDHSAGLACVLQRPPGI